MLKMLRCLMLGLISKFLLLFRYIRGEQTEDRVEIETQSSLAVSEASTPHLIPDATPAPFTPLSRSRSNISTRSISRQLVSQVPSGSGDDRCGDFPVNVQATAKESEDGGHQSCQQIFGPRSSLTSNQSEIEDRNFSRDAISIEMNVGTHQKIPVQETHRPGVSRFETMLPGSPQLTKVIDALKSVKGRTLEIPSTSRWSARNVSFSADGKILGVTG